MARRKKTATASSFPKFLRLPVEIQDEIWKIALNIEAPTVQFITLNCVRDSSNHQVWKLKSARINTRGDESRSKTIFPTRLALLLTCELSRRTVERLSRNWAPTNSVSLETWGQPRTFCASPFITPDRVHDNRTGRRTTIDTSNDLTVLYNPWCAHLANQQIPLSHKPRCPEIKYAGIFYAPKQMDAGISTYQAELEAILRVFPDLRVLYLIIHPDHVRKRIVDPMTQYMEDYYKACLKTRDKVPSKTFKSRDRIYYEMPKKLPLDMCKNLERLITKLWELSDRHHRGPRLVVRVMTWKHAPGVRERFDL
ncbi:hypothetical protein F53441_12871 [Fusarium austroafricanum]|uniref:2EXR domain-containing protein n=1 Tax=Fusarium austroafricanum TaxID=2364996 RepID=A0A8H4JUY1_9HYPO|nr:hypothetical protein F53441_12871 [Fusarium austroafricanum]